MGVIVFEGRTLAGAAQDAVKTEFHRPSAAAHLQAAMMVMLPDLQATVADLQVAMTVMPLLPRMPIVHR